MAVRKRVSRRERRGHARADATLSMRVEPGVAAAPQIVTETQNISASGVYCSSTQYLAPLSKVQLTIVLPKLPSSRAAREMVKCEGIVVRCDETTARRSAERTFQLACMFSDLDTTRRSRIEEFVTWRNLQALRQATRAVGRPTRKKATTTRKVARRTTTTAARGARKRTAKRA